MTTRQAIHTDQAPKAIGPYSQAVRVGNTVYMAGQIPLDPAIREAGDAGTPIVLSAPDSAAGTALREIAEKLAVRRRGLAGMSLGIDTTRHL